MKISRYKGSDRHVLTKDLGQKRVARFAGDGNRFGQELLAVLLGNCGRLGGCGRLLLVFLVLLVLLLTASSLFLAADLPLLGGLGALFLDGSPQLTEDVVGGHTNEQHDQKRQGNHAQGDGSGQLQSRIQEITQHAADHAAALENGAGLVQLDGVIDRGQLEVLGADAHVDEGGDQDHEKDGHDGLHDHQVLSAVTAPKDGEVHEHQREEAGGPAEASEQDLAEVVTNDTGGMGGRGLVARQQVQNEEHRKDQSQSGEYVGQVLLGKVASLLGLRSLTGIASALCRLLGGGCRGGAGLLHHGLVGGFGGRRLGLLGCLGRRGSGYDPLALGGRGLLCGRPRTLGRGFLLLIRFSHM